MHDATEPRAHPRWTPAWKSGLLLYLAIALAIAALLSLYYIVKHRVFAFVDIGLDTFSFYYPIQLAQAHQLRELHQLTWSFDLGLGGYLGLPISPLRLLCSPLPDIWQLAVRLPIYFARVVLSGAFFYGYLRRLRMEGKLSIIGALAFAYSSYAVVNGQWDSEGVVILQFAAYLYFFESYLRGGKLWFAVAAGVTLGAGSIFYPFTFAILTILYVCARPVFIARPGIRDYVATLAKYGCWALLGFLLTAFIQIPNLHYFMDSPRISGGHSVFAELWHGAWTLNSGQIISAEIAGIFGKDTLGVASAYHGYSNWFEAPGFYAGMLPLLCISQLFSPWAKSREKLLGTCGLALFAAYLLWPAMRYAVYGFGHPGFRLSTLWVSAGLLVLGLAGLRRALESGTWRPGLVAAAGFVLVALLAVAFNARPHVWIQHVAMVLAFTAVYCAVLWRANAHSAPLALRVLIPLFACELLLFSTPAFMQRTAVNTDGASRRGSYHDGTGDALAMIRKTDPAPDFYRVEKMYQSIFLNDALVQGYSGTKSDYFHGSSITRFVDKMHLPRTNPRTAYIASMAGRPKVLDLLGVRYLLARDRKLDDRPGMVFAGKAGKINVYRNTAAHGVAHVYHEVVGEDEADKMSQAQRDDLLLEKVVVGDPKAMRHRLAILDAGSPNAVPSGSVSLDKFSDIHLLADAATTQAGILLIAMPYDIGWRATINGTPIDLFRADYGLTALLLPAGRHQVELRYFVRGRRLGKWLSLAALLGLLTIALGQILRKRSRKGTRAD